MKHDTDNQIRALIGGLLRCPKVSQTVHKRLKTGSEFLPTVTILFCPIALPLLGINVTPYSDSR